MKTAPCCSKPSTAKKDSKSLRAAALVGNPNSGKTTLFNALTGSHQKVGNYPGVTVERSAGTLDLESESITVIDLPGLYSVNPISEDEAVAVEVLEGTSGVERQPDLVIYVLDAANLERNLYLFAKTAQYQIPTVVALTMTDRLARDSQEVKVDRLSERLGVPVVPVVGRSGRGLDELKLVAANALEDGRAPLKELASLGQEGSDAQPSREIQAIYAWATSVKKEALGAYRPKRSKRTEALDRFFTGRCTGLLAFALAMFVIFESIYTLAQPLMDMITNLFTWLADVIKPHLHAIPWLQSLICDGLIMGVGSMLVFLPQIAILFLFIAILEGTGYLARAAFLMDRLLGWCGLNGRAFIPLLSSFACAIPGIMAARVMPDKRSRLATILVAPLMSCSARLPVYLLVIGAFIEPRLGPTWAAVTLFGMYLVGLAVAIPIAWFFNRSLLKGKKLPFTLELPPYQWPKWSDVWVVVWSRGKVFVTTAGTTIVVMSILIWGLSYFPRSEAADAGFRAQAVASNPRASADAVEHSVDEERLSHSYLGQFGHFIQPVFEPAGFDWRITTGILSAFPARETVVPTLGILFKLGSDVESQTVDLRGALETSRRPDGSPLLTTVTGIGLMVFFALCCQCMSTLATVQRETNSWKWPLFMFTYMTALAYIAAVAINQIGLLVGPIFGT